MNYKRHCHSSCELQGKVYVFGGFNSLLPNFHSIEMLDVERSATRWQTIAKSENSAVWPSPRRNAIMIPLEASGKIVIFGGLAHNRAGVPPYGSLHLFLFDAETETFEMKRTETVVDYTAASVN